MIRSSSRSRTLSVISQARSHSLFSGWRRDISLLMTVPRHLWPHDTVSALVYSLAKKHAGEGPEFLPPYNDLTRFVLRQQSQMPDYLQPLMSAATLGFDLCGLLRGGGLFHSRPPDVREKQIAAWKNSKLSFRRDLVRYY